MTNKWWAAIFLWAAFPSAIAEEEAALPDGVSYIEGGQIVPDSDKYSEAQKWSMCAAIYIVSAEIFMQDKPASLKRAQGLSSGARVAAWITLFAPVLTELSSSDNPDMNRFSDAWESSKMTSGSMVDAAMTKLASDMEISREIGSIGQWLADIAASMVVCSNSSEAQEAKVNMMRELSSSGLFQIQEDK